MNKLRRIGLYGISGTGKTTILKQIVKKDVEVIWLEGARLVLDAARLTLDNFKRLSNEEKYFYREKAIEKAFEIQEKEKKDIIIDGHLVFAKGDNRFEHVLTSKDEQFYTEFIYLKPPIELVYQRILNDTTRKRNYTKEVLSSWMEYELNALRELCDHRNLRLNILEATELETAVAFVCKYIESKK